jgi:hemolysin D
MSSIESLVRLPVWRNRRRDEVAFLPAALEIVETPASPLGRAIALTITALLLFALAWATIGVVDIVVSAPGKIIPSGRSKVVQPFEAGVVRAIRVQDGQAVAAGDVLIELDPTINEAQRNHLQGDLIAAELDVARLNAALSDRADPTADFHPPAAASPDLVATQRQFLIDQVTEHRARLAALDRQEAQKAAERSTIAAAIEQIETINPVVQERADIRKVLYDHQTGSRLNYLDALQAVLESRKDLALQQGRLREAEQALAAVTQTRAQTEAEFRRTIHGEFVEAERKAAGLAQDLSKAERLATLQVLTAPVAGVVQQLAVHTIGGVVSPGQTLLVIVPSDGRLEIDALVANRDVGFVQAGQAAEIKVDTFNFTRYGVIHGTVLDVSRDSIVHERSLETGRNRRDAGAENESSEPAGQELAYTARVALDRTQMQVDGRTVDLAPGLAVTVEIKTGTRRIISYLLSPLLRYQQESLHER